MKLGLGLGLDIRSGRSAFVPPSLEWVSDAGVTGSPVDSWAAATGSGTLTATLTTRPSITANAFGSVQGITFDGSNDILKVASKLVSATSAGTLAIAFKTPATVAAGVLVSQADSAAANKWFEVGIDSSGRIYVEYNNAGTKHTVVGSTVLEASTVYDLVLAYDGTDYYLTLNGIEENPLTISNVGTFAWFGAVTGTVHFAIGGTSISGGPVRYASATVAGVWFWNSDITA